MKKNFSSRFVSIYVSTHRIMYYYSYSSCFLQAGYTLDTMSTYMYVIYCMEQICRCDSTHKCLAA